MGASEVGNIHIGLYVDIGDSRRFTDVANLVERDSRRMNSSLANTSNAVRGLRTQMGANLRIKLANESLKDLSRATDEVARLRAAMLGVSAIAGAGFTGAFTGAYLVQTADKYRLLTNQITTVTDSSASLATVQDELFSVSQRTRSSLESTTQIYARTARATDQYGYSQQKLLRITETIQKSFAIGGATPQEATGAALQLSQGIASNRFGGDEYRSVAENAPVLLKGIAKAMNVDLGTLRKMSTEGQLTAQTVTEAIVKASTTIDAEFAKTIPTVAQSFTLLDNAFLRYVGQTDDAYGGTKALAGAIKGLADNFDQIMPYIANVTGGLVALYAARKLVVGGQGVVAGVSKTNSDIRDQIGNHVDESKAISKRLSEIDAEKANVTSTRDSAIDSIAVKQSNAINAAKEKEYLAQQKLRDLETQRNGLADKLNLASNEELGRLQRQIELQRQIVRDNQALVIQAQQAAAAEEQALRAKQAQKLSRADQVVGAAVGGVASSSARVAETQAAIAAERELAKVKLNGEIDSRRQSLVTQTQRLKGVQSEIAELRSIQDLSGFDQAYGKQYKGLLGQQQKAMQSTQALYKEIDSLENKLGSIDAGEAATRGITAAMSKHAQAVQAAEKAVNALSLAEANRTKIASTDLSSSTLDRRLAAEAKSIQAYQDSITELQTRMRTLSDATNEAFTGKAASKLSGQISDLDGKIVSAQNNLKTASAAIAEAQGGNIGQLNSALKAQSVAAEELNKLGQEAQVLLERQVLTTNRIAAAQQRLNVLRRAGGAVLDFFGGWTGLLLTGALVGATALMAKFGAESAASAQQTEKITKQLTDLGYLTGKAADDMKAFKDDVANVRISKLQIELTNFQQDIKKTLDSLGNIDLGSVGPSTQDIQSEYDVGLSTSTKVLDANDKVKASFKQVRDEIVKNKGMSEAARKSLENMALANPDIASIAMSIVNLGDRLNGLKKATDDWVKGIQDAARAANTNPAQQFRASENQSMSDLTSLRAGSQPILDKKVTEANRTEYEAAVKSIMDGIAKELEKAGKLVDLGPIRAAAEKIYTSQQAKRGLLDLIGTTEGTDKGRGYNETLGYGRFTNGPVNLTQMNLDEVLALQSKMLDQTRALPSTDPLYNSSAVGRYQITSETLRDMMKQLNLSGDTVFNQETQDRIAQQIIRSTGGDASKLRGRWPSLNNTPNDVVDAASKQTLTNLPRMDVSTQKWIDGLKDLDLQGKVKSLNEFDQQVLQTGQSMGTTKEEMLQYIAAVTSGDIDKIPDKFKVIQDSLKMGIDNGFGRQLKDLRDSGGQKILTDLQQQVIQTAKSFGATEPEIKAYVQALTDGRLDQIPDKFKKIQDALQIGIDSEFSKQLKQLSDNESIKFLSDLQQKVVETARQFGLSEPEIRAYVAAVSDNRLDQVPAKFQAITDQLQKTAENDHLIQFTDGLADSIGSLFTDMANGDDAFGNLIKNLEKLVVQILIVEPIVASLKASFRNLAGGVSSSAGFDIGATSTSSGGIISSIFGSKGLFGGILGLADGGPSDIVDQKAGAVRGPGGPRSDKKLVYLSNGEYVFDAEATKNAGVEQLQMLQQYLKRGKLSDLLRPKSQKMADGGAVQGGGGTVPSSQYLPGNQKMVAANGNNMASSLARAPRAKAADNLHISFETKVSEDGTLQTYVAGVARTESASSVKSGISQYDRTLPDRMDQIKRSPKKR